MFETFLFLLTLVKLFQRVHEMRGEQTALYVFVRDGTWAFVVLFGENTPQKAHAQED